MPVEPGHAAGGQMNPGTVYTGWKITFYTLDNGKDSDTALTVQVTARSGVLAHYNGFGASGNAHYSYRNGAHDELNLAKDVSSYPSRAGATRLRIRIDPTGRNTWTFRYILTARTSAGAWETMKSGYGRLSEANREAIIR